ncbi:hypothetical protein ARMGADRAFT_341854 [Armillaria gallica]|uniref:DUF6532 domain-containing protein n=1 Tax=Armillaria gallica TaxID=47427 RepID=A0A2H3D5J2_ARMGA|nr:hypothetical protein ARMGADRAFT_341854 [Armillaria gallica]
MPIPMTRTSVSNPVPSRPPLVMSSLNQVSNYQSEIPPLQRSSTQAQSKAPSQLDPNLELRSMHSSQLTVGEPSLSTTLRQGTPIIEPFSFESHEMDQFIQANIVGAIGQRVESHTGNTNAVDLVPPSMGRDFADSDDEGIDLPVQSSFKVTSQPVNIPTRRKHKSRSQTISSANESMSEGDSDGKDAEKPVQRRKKRSRTIKDIVDEEHRNILKHAYSHYKRMLTCENAFPMDSHDRKEVTDMTVDAWDAACEELGIEDVIDPTQLELNLIRDRGSQFRGQLKDIVCNLLIDIFGFQDIKKLRNPNKERIEAAKTANRSLVQVLKGDDDPMRFIYSDPLNPTAKGTMFQNPIFQIAINMHWFGQKERARSSFFSMEKSIPLPTIALVASAIDCAIDEWCTGLMRHRYFMQKRTRATTRISILIP